MAISIAFPRFKDLGHERTVTLVFLLMDHFLYQFSAFSEKMKKIYRLEAGATIGDEDRKHGAIYHGCPRILRRHVSARIHAHVGGSRVDAVTLPDRMVRVARFSCRFFTAMAGNKARNKSWAVRCYALN